MGSEEEAIARRCGRPECVDGNPSTVDADAPTDVNAQIPADSARDVNPPAPVDSDAPASINTAPVDVDAPVDEGFPMDVDDPADGDAPVDSKAPIDVDDPADFDDPVDVNVSGDCVDPPVDVDSPVDVDAPVEVDPQVAPDKPVDGTDTTIEADVLSVDAENPVVPPTHVGRNRRNKVLHHIYVCKRRSCISSPYHVYTFQLQDRLIEHVSAGCW